MSKISQYPQITALTGTELILMDQLVAGNRNTVTATTNTFAQAVASGMGQFSSITGGIVPASGGGTINALRADGTWTSTFTGPWTLSAPASGATLTINCLQVTAANILRGPNTGAGWNLQFFDTTNALSRGLIGLGTNTVVGAAVTDFAICPGSGGSVVIGTGAGAAIGSRFGPSGNVVLNAATTGVTLLVVANTANEGLRIQGNTAGTASRAYISFTDSASARLGYVGNPAVSGGDTVLESDNGHVKFIPVSSTGQILGSRDGGATFNDMTPDAGTFLGTFTGFTAGVTGTATWVRIGKLVLLTFPSVSGTSNTTAFTMTGLPAAIQPATLTQQMPIAIATNNSALVTNAQAAVAAASGTVTFDLAASATGWTASGTKGLSVCTIAYLLS
jgi:hypothetical protein